MMKSTKAEQVPDSKPLGAAMDEATPVAVFDRFARFYDADYRYYDDDVDLILSLAEAAGDPILELGCGTGRLLMPLAAAGHTITGVDISPGLLALAQQKLERGGHKQRINLLEDDLRKVELADAHYAFAFCVSNTLMHLTTPADQLAVLARVCAALRPGGLLLIDLFNPDIPRLLAVDGLKELADSWHEDKNGVEISKWSVRTVDLAAQLQDTLFIYEEVWPDGSVRQTVCPFRLRFLWRHEAELMLSTSGFRVEEVWGDFDGGPYETHSDRLILLATRAA